MDTGRLPEVDRNAFAVGSALEPSDKKAYWLSKTPCERLAAVEMMRQIIYGYDPSTLRLQRVLESDRELIQAVPAGDRAAYGLLYNRHAPLIRAVCHDRARNLLDTQDLAKWKFMAPESLSHDKSCPRGSR